MSHFKPTGEAPPVFKIDLSLPPAERYVQLAHLYRDRMRSLVGIFDDLIESISPQIPLKLVHWLAWLCLRGLYTAEETAEIRGISRETGVQLYLLVCLNVVLDLLMGCTSGGVRVRHHGSQMKMLHFRTLDWGMDPLRELVVQLDYVQGAEPDKVLATSITYVGFVGVLTGVRKDLSVSLNFRPVHDPTCNVAFYLNHILVLLGFRRSIASLLRQCIMPLSSESKTFSSISNILRRCGYTPSQEPVMSTLRDIITNLPKLPTTAAYLIFSDGKSTVRMEKDYRTAVIRSSPSFIVITNNDQQPDSAPTEIIAEEKRRHHTGLSLVNSDSLSMTDIIEDSNERSDCMQQKWNARVLQHSRVCRTTEKHGERVNLNQSQVIRSSRLSRKQKAQGAQKPFIHGSSMDDSDAVAITPCEAIEWLTTYPIVNETTHYAVIMDSSEGEIVWVERY